MIPAAVLLACPNLAVPPRLMYHVAMVESDANRYAIGVVGGRLLRQPASLEEAIATARSLETQGYNFSVGVAQQHTDGRIGWERDDRKWGLAIYARNMFNKRYVESIGNTTTNTLGTPYATVSAPRIIGIEAHVSL